MATDKSEPKTGLIAALSLFVVLSLVGVREGLKSYFISMHEAEVYVKVTGRPAQSLSRLHETEARRLQSGSVTIDQAMAQLASGPRPAAIVPRPSTDLAPLQGWSGRPTNLVSATAPAAAPAHAPAAAQPPVPVPAPTPAPGAPAPATEHGAAPTAPPPAH